MHRVLEVYMDGGELYIDPYGMQETDVGLFNVQWYGKFNWAYYEVIISFEMKSAEYFALPIDSCVIGLTWMIYEMVFIMFVDIFYAEIIYD